MDRLFAAALLLGSALTPPVAATFPRYERSLLLETTSETSANVSFGDLDRDGNLDIVLAKGRHWPLIDRVLLGDGRGGIRSAFDLGTIADRSYSALLADLNGDGALDVVISNDAPDPKRVYFNDGTGHFRMGSTYGQAQWETRNAAVADLNGDGRADIVVANRFAKAGSNYICFNRGRGQFDADCTPVAPYPTTTITPGDFNHDGRPDLAVPHRDGGQSFVYLAAADGTLSEARRVPFGPRDAHIRISEVADFDRDGALDIATVDERVGVALYFGQRDGSFTAGVSLATATVVPYALAVADLDGNGSTDVVVGHVEAPSTIYFNDGAGRHFTPEQFGDNKGTAYGFAIGDFDRDGVADIAAARSDAPNVLYFGRKPSSR